MAAPACRWRKVAGFPDLLDLHALNPERYPHLLESVAHQTPQARFDILFAFPGETLTLDKSGVTRQDGNVVDNGFLDTLHLLWRSSVVAPVSEPPLPFLGGWFVFLGYELAREIEPALSAIPASSGNLVAMAQRFLSAIIRDHEAACTYLVSEIGSEQFLDRMQVDLELIPPSGTTAELPRISSYAEEESSLHRQRIARALRYIQAGDSYQANLARSWRAEFESPPAASDMYRLLRSANPSPFAALATLGPEQAIVSSSPERLAAVRDGRISTRPIAGTYPRSEDEVEDRSLPVALARNPKERAEHIMLVDLERNDLGRLCRSGSVHVEELLTVESYRHVHHLVSDISGQLRDDISPVDVIRAVFPGGTITGCPKVRTMQIIAELEGRPRGAYTGSVGYINRDGSLDLNILIRTLMIDGRQIEWRAGGGIVADSDPDREIRETRAKARGMLAALGLNGTI